MRLFVAILVLITAALALALWADDAEATAQCQPAAPVANSCQGNSGVGTTTGGVASGRCFFFKTTSSTPACSAAGIITTGNLAYQLDAGACTTLYFFNIANGLTPPATPNKMTLQVAFDDTTTIVKTYLLASTSVPASGTSYTFCATTDGNSGSPDRAGTVFLYLNAIKDDGNGLPGNTNYNVATNGVGTQDTSQDAGYLRAATKITSITRNAYPGGSTYAYGPSGDEVITPTCNFTPPFADTAANRETWFTSVLDEATLLVGASSATADVDSGTISANHVVDSTFPQASGPYVAGCTIAGNSFFGLRYSILTATGHGNDVVRVSDTFAYNSLEFNVDPRIIHDSDGAGTYATADDQWENRLTGATGTIVSAENRGEAVWIGGYILNARSEQLTRQMTINLEDASAVVCGSAVPLTPTAGKYSTTYTVPTAGSCTVTNTDPGSPRYVRATNTDQNKRSAEDHTVSSLYYLTAHPQLSSTRSATPDLTFLIRATGGGADDSDTIYLFCRVESVRHDPVDTSGTAVSGSLRDPTAATRASETADTGSDGWTPTSLDMLATTPLGTTWEGICAATMNGNTGTHTQLFTVGVEGGGGGETVYTGSDPLTVHALYNATSGDIEVGIASRFLDGTARLDAEDEIFFDVYNTAYTLLADDQPVIEPPDGDGAYAGAWTPPTTGVYLVVAHTLDPESGDPVGAHGLVVVSQSTGNATVDDVLAAVNGHRLNSIEVLMTNDFFGMGFDGFLFFIFWWIMLLLFVFKWELEWCAAFTVPAILVFVVPDGTDYDWDMLFSIICIIFGVLVQFLVDRHRAKKAAAGTGEPA